MWISSTGHMRADFCSNLEHCAIPVHAYLYHTQLVESCKITVLDKKLRYKINQYKQTSMNNLSYLSQTDEWNEWMSFLGLQGHPNQTDIFQNKLHRNEKSLLKESRPTKKIVKLNYSCIYFTSFFVSSTYTGKNSWNLMSWNFFPL